MSTFDVNINELIKLTAKLERIRKSAFPSAVRETLNDTAFAAKKLIPKTAAQKLITRRKGFINAFTIVDRSSGWNVSKMEARIGINGNKNSGQKTAEGLAKQETGGSLIGRKLIPHRKARTSGSYEKTVKKKHRFSNINIGRAGKKGGGSKYILIKKGGKGTVFEVKKIKGNNRLNPVFNYSKNQNRSIKGTSFIEISALIAAKRMPDYYMKNAEYQFKKALQ